MTAVEPESIPTFGKPSRVNTSRAGANDQKSRKSPARASPAGNLLATRLMASVIPMSSPASYERACER
jgi:hypothetical protein